MKNSDQTLEKLLSQLSSAEVPPGMNRRILQALEHRASTSAFGHNPAPRWLVTAGALASALALVLAASAIHRFTQAPTHSAQIATPVHPPSRAYPGHDSIASPTPIAYRPVKHRAHRAPQSSSNDLLAEREMRASSLPAPPMPLTEQEKLLLRIAHSGDPVELAALDPLAWAAKDAADKAKFDKFFAPPPTQATGDNQ